MVARDSRSIRDYAWGPGLAGPGDSRGGVVGVQVGAGGTVGNFSGRRPKCRRRAINVRFTSAYTMVSFGSIDVGRFCLDV